MTIKTRPDIIILGGGLAGLAAAWKLSASGAKVTVIEAMDHVGGLASSFSWRGTTLDIGPHKLYPQSESIRSFLLALLGEDLVEQKKVAGIWLRGEKLRFPPSMKSGSAHLSFFMSGILSYAGAFAASHIRARPDDSYEDYVINRFGRYLYEQVLKPQATKLWGRPDRLSSELGRVRMPYSSLSEVIIGAVLKSRHGPEVSAGEFYYPKGGIGELAGRLAEGVTDNGGRLLLGRKATAVRPSQDGVEVDIDKERLSANAVISTIAPDSLVRVIEPPVPGPVRRAADALKFRSLIVCYLSLGLPRFSDDHWIVFPEERYCFNRIYEARAFGIKGERQDETIIAVEVTVDVDDLWSRDDDAVADSIISDLVTTGLIKKADVLASKIIRIKRAYPLLSLGYEVARELVLSYLHGQPNVLCCGRSGLFIYNNMDHSLDMGLSAAEHILDGSTEAWPMSSKRFEGARIID